MPELPRRKDDYYDDDDDEFDDDDVDDDLLDDDFTKFCRYRGQEAGRTSEARPRRGRYVCLHYYSNTVGLSFGDETNVEVYKMDQIKEWASTDPNWLDNLQESLEHVAGKQADRPRARGVSTLTGVEQMFLLLLLPIFSTTTAP
jgi:hypothetical protein